jgi:hypothetical protein
MTDESKLPPAPQPPEADPPGAEVDDMSNAGAPPAAAPVPPNTAPPRTSAPPEPLASPSMPPGDEEVIGERITRLSGEAAPDLSPEEFARLQRSGGAINIDPRGRIRVGRRDETDPGVSLRKRRAWYA